MYVKHYEIFFVFSSVCVFKVWPQTTLLLPVWPRDAKGLDTLGIVNQIIITVGAEVNLA